MSNGDRRRVHQIRCQRDERSLTDYISDTQERDSIHVVILSAGTAKEAVMDDHTFFLLGQADEQLRRTALLIEQHRLHIMCLHPSRRHCEETKLKSLMSDYARLLNYRHVLTTEPSYALMN